MFLIFNLEPVRPSETMLIYSTTNVWFEYQQNKFKVLWSGGKLLDGGTYTVVNDIRTQYSIEIEIH